LAAGLAPLVFFPISSYLGIPEIKKAASRLRGTAEQECLVGGSNVIGAGRWRELG
jgi:hypothetical protein